jgi:hypothetical protein
MLGRILSLWLVAAVKPVAAEARGKKFNGIKERRPNWFAEFLNGSFYQGMNLIVRETVYGLLP